jgi:hypothetical protein
MSVAARGAAVGALVVGLFTPVHSGVAQVTVTPSVFVAYVEHQVNIGFGGERTNGPVLGAAVHVAPVRFVDVTLSGYAGTLVPDSANLDSRRMADLELATSVFATPTLALQVRVRAQSYTTSLARQRWTSFVVGGEFAPLMFDGAARAVFRAGLAPVTSVSGSPNASFGATGAAGFEFLRGPLTGALLFSLDRYDFPAASQFARSEQVVMLGAELGVRFPR